MCQCLPDALEPPNQKIKQCRLLLQLLCASLVIIGTLAILVKDIFGFINCLIYAYILYMAWATFNWCILLLFFLLLLIQTIQVYILFAGMYSIFKRRIQYKQLFAQKHIMDSVYVLLQVFYLPTAIYISHYVYRHFKNQSEGIMGIGQVFPQEQPANAPVH